MKFIHCQLISTVVLLCIPVLSCSDVKQQTSPSEASLRQLQVVQKQAESISTKSNNTDEAQTLSRFIRRIFEDSKGNYWFGTNGDGVIRYDGKNLNYYTQEEGFSGLAVRAILEDKDRNVWFGTEEGISKFDGKSFINYTKNDGLLHNDVWSMTLDKEGRLWIGTFEGACLFDGKKFEKFELPRAQKDDSRGVSSEWIVHTIIEDRKGRIWLGNNGGAHIYDGSKLTHLSTADGLCDNHVNAILEDSHGHFWFATHHNGVCKWDGQSFTHFDNDSDVYGSEVWSLTMDRQNNIWFPSEGYGIYLYDGQNFMNFSKEQGLESGAIQCIYQDSKNNIWAGGYMGLFRLENEDFIPISKNGPWQ